MTQHPNTSSRPFVIGVAGGSGSGKTTVVQSLISALGRDEVAWIAHDFYYRDQQHKSMEQRVSTNYDHPNALETSLLIDHLHTLLSGEVAQIPQYDFVQHTRSNKTLTLQSAKVILVEGILLFESQELRELFDLKVFVDTEADVRLARRLVRDVQERGRTYEYCLEQYMQFTRPMHLEFVEPSKRYADIILPEGMNAPAIDVLVAKVLKEIGGTE